MRLTPRYQLRGGMCAHTSRLWRHDRGSSSVEWVSMAALIAVLMAVVTIGVRAQGASIGTTIGQVIHCHIAAFTGGGRNCGSSTPSGLAGTGFMPQYGVGSGVGVGMPVLGLLMALNGDEQVDNGDEPVDNRSLSGPGEQMKRLYELYRATPGWWNENGDRELTLQEFVGMMAIFEAAGELDIETFIAENVVGDRRVNEDFREIYVEAIGRWIWMQVPGATGRPFCEGDSCYNGVLNLLGEGWQSARSRLAYTSLPNTYNSLPDYGEHLYNDYRAQGLSEEQALRMAGEAVMEQARIIGNEVLNPQMAVDNDWIAWDPDAPFTWGNGPDDPDPNSSFPVWDSTNRDGFNALAQKIADALEGGEALSVNGNDVAWYARGYWREPGDPGYEGFYLFAILSYNQQQNLRGD